VRIEELSRAAWGDALPSSGFGVFHTPAALGVLDDHTAADLRLLGGFNGDRPVALLPLFVTERPVGTTVLSPPPSLSVPQLGPVLMPASPKRRKRERLNNEFAGAVLDRVGVDRPTTLFRMSCDVGFGDPRPYAWADLTVRPRFTYVLDLADASPDQVLDGFSKSLRRDVRRARESDVHVDRVSSVDGAKLVYDDTRDRYEEQGRELGPSWPYVRDLSGALGDRCRSYLARDDDGGYLGGITVLYSNDRAYFWQGGTRSEHDVAVNGLLHWHILEDVATDPPIESVSAYDLMGANTERLCRYKSKFGADLRHHYVVESAGYAMDVAKRVYERVGR
jgi:hypothetical protein